VAASREITVDVHASHGEEVAALLVEQGAQGAWIEDDQTRAVPGRAVVETGRATVRASFGTEAGLEARVVAALGGRLRAAQPAPDLVVTWRDLEEQDWNAAWKAQWQVQRIGRRLCVVPSWLEHAAQPGDLVLVMDPGMAFGTGTHETTRLCAEALEELVTTGCSLLDVGCGTGILALFAARLGAATAVAVDNDPDALAVARATAERNGLTTALQLVHSERVQVQDVYDVVVANILMQPLLELRREISARVRAGGWLVLSGLLVEQLDTVSASYAGVGMVERARATRGEWGLLRLRPGLAPGGFDEG
jgi:ribosomal protein L11 methyltransferase